MTCIDNYYVYPKKYQPYKIFTKTKDNIAQSMFNKKIKIMFVKLSTVWAKAQHKHRISILAKDHSTSRKSFVLIVL